MNNSTRHSKPPKLASKKRSILLVDDDRLIVSNITHELTQAGYQVSSAGTVDKAEIWLENNPKPDLVILDVRMPKRDGIELVKRLKELGSIPFILLTAYSEAAIIQQANTLGAMGYVVKPVSSTELIPAIEIALARADEQQTLQLSTQNMHAVLDVNRAINIAVGITMLRFNQAQDQAFELLRTAARNQNKKLVGVAADVIKEFEATIVK